MKKQQLGKSLSRRQFIRQAAMAGGAFMIVPRYVLGGRGFVAPSDKVTLGIIGCGKQAPGLAKRFMELSGVQLLAASDVFEEKQVRMRQLVNEYYAAAKEQSNYQAFETYHRYEDLLARTDIDAVVIALPDHWHAIASIEAMKAGKDVYCEKPLAHTVKEGRAMVKAARKYQRIVQTGSMQRSWRNFRHACELVRNGYIGQLQSVKVNVGDPAKPYDLPAEPMPAGLDWDRWLGPAPVKNYNHELAPNIEQEAGFWPNWRNYREFGGGILCDWGAHMFDIAQWGLGMDDSGPQELIPPADPTATRGLKFVYAGGLPMIHEDFGRGWAVQFNGTEGRLEVSRSFLESDPASIVTAEIKEGEKRLYLSDNHYQDWIDCIHSRQLPICDVEVGHRTATVCNIANIAYQLHRPLTWNPEREKFKGDKEANRLLGKNYRKPYTL